MIPAVSVVIPTYNREAYIGSAVASVLAQTFRDFELIVVDDGSTDATPGMLQELAARDARIRVIHSAGPRGPGGARNAGLAQARAEWVAFLDSDDRWAPEILDHFMAAAAPGVVLIGSDYRMVDEEKGSAETMKEFLLGSMVAWWEQHAPARHVVDCARLRSDISALAERRFMIGMIIGGFLWIGTSTVMARRSDVLAVGGFDARLTRTEDTDLWMKLLPRGRVVYVDRVLATCDVTGRESGTGQRYATHRTRRHDSYIEAGFHLRLLKSMPRRFDLDAHQRAFVRERISATRRRCGFAAQKCRPLAAALHYAAALAFSKEQRASVRAEGWPYFLRPW